MVKSIWNDANQKAYEWEEAKKKLTDSEGRLLANGTKLSRKTSGLSHSFMVIDNKILAINVKGAHLGRGAFGRTKLAEDEQGRLFAIKMSTFEAKVELFREAEISSDLHIAGQPVTRMGGSSGNQEKNYLAYTYLGTTLDNYLFEHWGTLSLDEGYELCIKLAVAQHKLHMGTQSKTKTAYLHSDGHIRNIVIDEHHNIHFIDFGLAMKADDYFFFYNTKGNIINLDTRDLVSNCNYILNCVMPTQQKMHSLANSTALNVAETFTMHRFQLESFQDMLKLHSAEERLSAVQILNAQNKLIIELYEQINALSGTQKSDFENKAKMFLLHQALSQTKNRSASPEFNQLFTSLDQNEEALKIKYCFAALLDRMEQENKLITQTQSLSVLIDDILSLKKQADADGQNKLNALNADLYEAKGTFFDRLYLSPKERAAAYKQFKARCDALITQAEADFADKPELWGELKLTLDKIADVSELSLLNKVTLFDDSKKADKGRVFHSSLSLFAAKHKTPLAAIAEEDEAFTP